MNDTPKLLHQLESDPLINHPIIFWTVMSVLVIGAFILALITYYKKWGYLWNEWLTSLDHKKIGVMYIILALVMLLRGFADAIMMRIQQVMAAGPEHGFLKAHHYNQVFGSHGTIMIIFVAMPMIIGLLNVVIPQQIGARDMAFPLLNSIAFYLTASGAFLVMVSLGIGEFSNTGWTGIAPLFEKAYNPNVGVDYWLWAVQLSGIGTTLSGINFFVTILKMRAPGLTLMKMPLFTWTAWIMNAIVIISFPVLTVALFLLTMDRYLDMHFFTNNLGGNVMMWANLFWMWGHPEVYIIILPAFGVFSEIVTTFSRKRLFGYRSLVFATVIIMVLSCTVWLHHFFTMGNNPNVNVFFGIATMLIAIPTGVKVYDWLFTMYKGKVTYSVPMYYTIGFLILFTLGGLTGVILAIPALDYVFHNSLFLVAHFHNMLIPGALFGYFAAINFWFPKVFGFKLNEKWGRRSFWGWFIGFIVAFAPLYILGFMGMPRRMSHYDVLAWQPYLIAAAVGVVFIGFGILSFIIQLYVSVKNKEAHTDPTGDPWDGRSLEWMTASPPAEYNFAVIPTVTDREEFWKRKENGTAYQLEKEYEPIVLPDNNSTGVLIGVFASMFGFAFVWHIWWLVIISFIAILVKLIANTFTETKLKVISSDEIMQIERERMRKMNKIVI